MGSRPLVQFSQQVGIADHQVTFRHNDRRVGKIEANLEALPRDPVAGLQRLVTIRDAGEVDHLALPTRFGELPAKEVSRVALDDQFRLEVRARAETQVFVIGPGVTIRAGVLTSPIRVDRPGKRQVGAVIS